MQASEGRDAELPSGEGAPGRASPGPGLQPGRDHFDPGKQVLSAIRGPGFPGCRVGVAITAISAISV